MPTGKTGPSGGVTAAIWRRAMEGMVGEVRPVHAEPDEVINAWLALVARPVVRSLTACEDIA